MRPRSSGLITGYGHDDYALTPPWTGPSGSGANIGRYELYHYYVLLRSDNSDKQGALELRSLLKTPQDLY